MKCSVLTMAGVAAVAFAAEGARGECAQGWSPLGAGVNGPVFALAVWDHDGLPETPDWLAVGGSFSLAGGVPASNVAVFDGSSWHALGAGVNGPVYALASHDADGVGGAVPVLAVGGDFDVPFDCGPGCFNGGIGLFADGAWQPASAIGTVLALVSHDPDGADSSPRRLYAGTESLGVLSWNGSSWNFLSGGPNFVAPCVALYSDPFNGTSESGRLWVAHRGGKRVGMWDGISNQFDSEVLSVDGFPRYSLAQFDQDGPGPRARAILSGGTGQFSGSTYLNAVVDVPNRGQFLSTTPNQAIYALVSFDPDGPSPDRREELVAGGFFTRASTFVNDNRVSSWNGLEWLPFEGPAGVGVNNTVFALAVWDRDGDGPQVASLVAGGEFTQAGGISASRVAAWNRCAPPPDEFCVGDANVDGTVNFDDLTTVLANFGGCR